MLNVEIHWQTNRKDWAYMLDHLDISQGEIAKFLGISDQSMSRIVRDMTDGKGLAASEAQKDRWNKAINYVRVKLQDKEESK